MPKAQPLKRALLGLSIAAITLGLSACADNRQPGELSAGANNGLASSAAQLTGVISDGPIDNTLINIYSNDGSLYETIGQDQKGNFSTQLMQAPSAFPLILTATTNVSLKVIGDPGFTLMSAIPNHASSHNVNLTPYTTMITKVAMNMPGNLDQASLRKAQGIVVKQFNFGLFGSLKTDPINHQVNESNGHIMIKTGEALAEMIRRTQQNLSQAGYSYSNNDVMNALSADLSDGVLDGQAAYGPVQPRISAVAHIVAGEVAIEAITNDLRINDQHITAELDYAIRTSFPSSRFRSENVHLTEEMIEQAYLSIKTASQIIPSPHLNIIKSRLRGITAFTQPERARRQLPPSSEGYLNNVVSYVASASDQEIKRVNVLSAQNRI